MKLIIPQLSFTALRVKLILYLMLYITLQNSYAVTGAELTYECLGNDTYELSLKWFNECTSASYNTPLSNHINTLLKIEEVGNSRAGCQTLGRIQFSFDTTYNVDLECNGSAINSCGGNNTSGLTNTNVSISKCTITLPCKGKFNIWADITYFNPNGPRMERDGSTNLTSGSSEMIAVVANIDNRYGCYDSPQFAGRTHPIYNTYLRSDTNKYSYGGIKRGEYDLEYQLINPKYLNNVGPTNWTPIINCSYPSGLNPTNPFFNNYFDFNDRVGEISFVPQSFNQSAAIACRLYMVNVNGDTIGFVEKDMLLEIIHTPFGGIPVLNTYGLQLISPAGHLLDTIAKQIHVLDRNRNLQFSNIVTTTGDTVSLNSSTLDNALGQNNINKFIFALNNRQDSVQCFYGVNQSILDKTGELPFSIEYNDKTCPLYGYQSISYDLIIDGAIAIADKYEVCPGVIDEVQLDARVYAPDNLQQLGSYNWRILGGINAQLSSSNIRNPILIIPFPHNRNDSIEIELDYTSAIYPNGSVVQTKDTLVLHYREDYNCLYPLAVEGFIFVDDNNNCQQDLTDTTYKIPLPLQFFKDSSDIFYTTTDEHGYYTIHLDTGNYIVSINNLESRYWISCTDTQHVHIDSSFTLQQLNFLIQPQVLCPKLEVNIAANRLRRCFTNNINVSYWNSGYRVANNSTIKVTLDTNLYYNSATAPLISQNGNVYFFDGGSLNPNEQKTFNINVTVSCSSNLGQIHCAEAHIYTDSICLLDIPNVVINDTCTADSVYFDITNLSHPYDTLVEYWLLTDSTIIDTGSIRLNIGNTYTVTYPTTSSSRNYQLVLAPRNANLITASNNNNCIGYATRLPIYQPYSNIGYRATFCQANRGSYDPNDKTGYPLGIGQAGYIPPNSAIDYRIRFQNTGTDTAIFINILDTIDLDLDITTLQMGASSHAYTWQLLPQTTLGQSVIRITFDSIYLPDSTTNLAASNGFVYYTIQQQSNLPNFRELTNSAAIYFDYNTPIQTNTTLHTVCDNCLPINLNGGVFTSVETIDVVDNYRIYPNPTKKYVYIQQHTYQPNSQWSIYSLQGQLLDSGLMRNNLEQIELENYSVGMYILTIQDEEQKAVFKLIVGE